MTDLCISYNSQGIVTRVVDAQGQSIEPDWHGSHLLDLVEYNYRGDLQDALTCGTSLAGVMLRTRQDHTYTLDFNQTDNQVLFYAEEIPDAERTPATDRLQKAYQRALQLRLTANATPIGMALVETGSRRVMRINDALQDMLGEPEALPDKLTIDAVLPNFDPAQYQARMQRVGEIGTLTFEQDIGLAPPYRRARLTVSKILGSHQTILVAAQDMSAEHARREATETLIDDLHSLRGNALYEQLVTRTAAIFALEHIIIVEHHDEGRTGRTLAAAEYGKLIDNYEYPLEEWACSALKEQREVIQTHGARGAYPEDQRLARLQAEAFVGVPVKNDQGQLLGHLACFHGTHLLEAEEVLAFFRLLAPIAAAELIRGRLQHDLDDAKARMQDMQKLESLGLLAGGIAHDFNNLLAAIMGNAELAQSKTQNESAQPTVQGHIEQILSSSKRAADLCNQLLAYAGQGRYQVQSFIINELINDMVHILDVSVSTRATLKLQLAADLAPVNVDQSQFSQLVLNLVTNATDALPETGGRIQIETGMVDYSHSEKSQAMPNDLKPGNYIFMEVVDNGAGMTAEVIERMFDPFYSTKGESRGLGLAAVLGITRGHGGGITVRSTPGKGTAVRVLLPAMNATDAVARPRRDQAGTDLDGLRILVVDDEEAVRNTIIAMLSCMGAQVSSAVDGLDALEHLDTAEQRPDLVLLDLSMPRLDGRATLKEIRQRSSDLPVLIMSGFSDQQATQEMAGQELQSFLQKPFTLDSLTAAIHACREQN